MTRTDHCASGSEQFVIAEWSEGITGPDWKITAHENGDGWLVLVQSKIHETWLVEQSYHSEKRPLQPDRSQEGGR